jgi:hypothetical protein
MSDGLDDGFSRAVRFFCGALFGAFLGVGFFMRSAWRYVQPERITSPFHGRGLLITLGLVAFCGFGAMIGGDSFWTRQD